MIIGRLLAQNFDTPFFTSLVRDSSIISLMKTKRTLNFVVPFALAGLLVAGGCRKTAPQANNTASTNANQPATTPPPPPDQNGGATAAPSSTPQPGSNGAPAATPAPTGPNAQQAQAPPPPIVIPAGTHIAVRVQQDLGSAISQAGETFSATVVHAVDVEGQTAIPAGSAATGTVVAAKPLGRFKGQAYLELRLDSVRADGSRYEVHTSTLERVEKGKGKRSAEFIGGGAGLGALIGGLAGGGKGALIGGLAGGGAGTAGAGLTGRKNIYIPAETTLTFRLKNSVHISQ